MSFDLIIRPEVDDDLLDAQNWYERRQPGLGMAFLLAARTVMDRLVDDALLYRMRHRWMEVRWVYLRRFPYRIVFRVTNGIVIIYAVLHAARGDGIWLERVFSEGP